MARKSGKWKYASFLISSTDLCYCCRQKSVIFRVFSRAALFFSRFVRRNIYNLMIFDVYIYKSYESGNRLKRCQQTEISVRKMKQKKNETKSRKYEKWEINETADTVSAMSMSRHKHTLGTSAQNAKYFYALSTGSNHLAEFHIVVHFQHGPFLPSHFDVHRMQLMLCKKLQIFSQVFSSVN